jgi:hypothetical protein
MNIWPSEEYKRQRRNNGSEAKKNDMVNEYLVVSDT